MNLIEQAQTTRQLPDDYGEQLWAKIEGDIPDRPNQNPWFSGWFDWLHQPRYSLASVVLVAGFCVAAYLLGAHQSPSNGADWQNQLLAQNIQMHLTQSEIFLTQVANTPANAQNRQRNQQQAQYLLTNNRLFKNALKGQDSQLTQSLINQLEWVLLEHANNPDSIQATNQTESTHNQLLFNVKAVKNQLAGNQEII